ncbi:hypothetical protein MA16_Dca022968 [Dendrobium catenatum]|uniref:Uncharacterized protein n=1 Tax=Dendrobium catenatum TaxID=906689 RepID=A0A2I0VCB3_9ASPA|nr:hypothetical protein MA16_Dca022968 [Dendrobium catenatum]
MGSSGVRGAETTHSLIPKFWESAMSIRPFEDDDDSCRFRSLFFNGQCKVYFGGDHARTY